MDTILVPGQGLTNSEAQAVNKAVQEYDERLRFGWNEANGDWIIYIRMPRDFQAFYHIDGTPVYPVLGFGQRIPSPQEALERLWKADTLRHGEAALDRMNSENEKLKEDAEIAKRAAQDESFERLEHALRKMGMDGKVSVFFPSKD